MDAIRASLRAALSIGVLGLAAWASGRPAVFPSLGPSAFVLATRPDAASSRPRRVIGGHVIGVLAGLAAYHALAAPIAITSSPLPLSIAWLRLAASATVATALTAGGMLATEFRHAPACATTLVVALGIQSTPVGGGVIVVAVVFLVGIFRVAFE